MISLRPQNINFQTSWQNHCQKQLKSLFMRNENGENYTSAIQLYSRIYELCISFPENHTMTLLKHIAQLFFESAVEIRQDILNSSSGINENSAILNLYVNGWKRYFTAFKAINGVCRYLNKCIRANYETAQYTGTEAICETETSSPGLHFQPVIVQVGTDKSERIELRITGIEDVAKSIWSNVIIRYFHEVLDNFLVKNFLSVMRQQDANHQDLKSFIESFRWCDDLNLIVSIEADTKDYYFRISEQFIENHSISAYVQFASDSLTKESERSSYLWEENKSAVDIIMRTCEMELIERHKEKLELEFERMLQSEKHSELTLLFKLLGKNEGASLALQQCFSQLIIKDFSRLHNALGQAYEETINLIKAVHQKYSQFIENAFCNDEKMLATLKQATSIIINQKVKNSWNLFSEFINESLSTNILPNHELFDIVNLFSSVTESFDEFILDYKNKLSQRIIYQSVLIEAEEEMIEIFKQSGKMSPEQNFHLKRMLLDYKDKQNDSVLVLTSHAWPSRCNPVNAEISSLPEELNHLLTKFEKEFKEAHCGRKLQWCFQLITLQSDNNTTMSLLQYQIIHSLPFGNGELRQLSEKFGRSLNDVTDAIKVLQKFGIIESKDEIFEFVHLPPNLNLIYWSEDASKSREIASSSTSNETETMSNESNSSNQIRQCFILQSLITTILKKHRQTSPAELRKILITSAEALPNGHAFRPQASQIEEAIDGLIGKGYLEFNEQDHLYIYVP